MSLEPAVQGHCFRCRVRKEMEGATEVRLRNGKMAVTGVCVTCGTRIFRLVRSDDSPGDASAARELQA